MTVLLAAASAVAEEAAGMIAFESRSTGMNVHVVAPDGTGLRKLTHGGGPSISADGRILCIVRYMNDTNSNDLFLVGADGSGERRVTKTPEMEQAPALSPDGSSIVYSLQVTREEAIVDDLYVMKADGTGTRRLTEGETPAWSPDGKEIAFAALRGSTNSDLFVIGADGAGERRVTDSKEPDREPAWSPDGGSIAMASYMDKAKKWDIRVIKADGTGLRRLTQEDGDDTAPCWSPDGKRIAFVSSRDKEGKTEIFVMNADGSDPRNITKNPSWDHSPAWGR